MLEVNEQTTRGSELDLRDKCADGMMSGPFALCPICSGHLSFSGGIYRCHGYISEWSKCSHSTLDPDRFKGKWKIPEETDNQFLLKWNKSQKSVKPKCNLPPESSGETAQGQGSKDAADFSRSEKLSYLKVSVAGDTKERQAWKKKIEEAGAEFHSNVKNGTSCLVVCGLTDIRDAEMRKPRRMKVATVRVVDCLKKQRKLPLDKYKIEDTFESPVTVKVKERSAVHEASGLQEHCHIFEDGDSIYNTTLSISDLSTGINSYFILQIIQEDKGSDCYAFRKWGRVGNEKIGGNKVEEMSKSDAVHEFKRLFLEKTGNSWESWEQKTNFQKQPGKFLPLDIDYGVNKQVAKKEPVQTSSNLAPPLIELMKMLFDVETYRNTRTSSTASNAKLEYGIEVSQTSRAGCRKCTEKILKGEVRIISKPEGPSNKGLMWHHAKCFLEMSSSTELESLSGWKNIPDSDQEALLPLVKKALPAAKTETAEACHSNSKLGTKRRNDSGDNEKSKLAKTSFDMSTSGALQPCSTEREMDAQTKELWDLKDDLKKYVTTAELREMLEVNEQSTRGSELDLRDKCADGMMFGPLALCPICSGHLSFSGRIYRCHGYISEWSKCSHFTLDPDRIKGKWKIPEGTENQFLLKWNKSQKSVKPKRNLRPESSAQGQGSKDAADFSRSEKLSDLKVSIAGDTKERQAWKKKIEEAGAEFHANVKKGTSFLVVCGLTDITILAANSSSATAEATNLNLDEQQQQRHSVDHPARRSLLMSLLVMLLVVGVGVLLITTFSSWCNRKKNLKKIKKRKSRKDRKGVTGILDPQEQEIDEVDDVVDPQEQEIDEVDEVDEVDDVVDPQEQKINEVDGVDEVEADGYTDVLCLCEDENLGSGKQHGKIFVSDKKIENGSKGKGYVVHLGRYDVYRPAAVKVFYLSHCKTENSNTENEMDITIDVTQIDNEIKNLCTSDSHANIIRLYDSERQKDFAWLCLERWKYSLDHLVRSAQNAVPVEAIWKAVGDPSPLMISLIRDIVSGLQHLHSLSIVHRNLTPSNVLITETLVAKLSDMGISKLLPKGKSFLDHHATCFSCPEWQAPELLRKEDETYATDMFRLGCVIFFALTGHHPFGPARSRDDNIRKNNRINFFQVKHHEASHLIDILLNPMSNLRPTSTEVLCHPIFWSSLKRLFFLRDASNRVEVADKEVLTKLWNREKQVLGLSGWNKKLDNGLINYIQSQRHYDYKSLRQLLRLVRNMTSHFWELPIAIQGLLGTYPEGLDSYFTRRFPKLLIAVYEVIYEEFKEESAFKMYFKESTI